eukprot:2420640-Karenia_brevis.AAC.1
MAFTTALRASYRAGNWMQLTCKHMKLPKMQKNVLRALPKKLRVKMDRPMRKQYPGLPQDWFSVVTGHGVLDP